LPVQNHVKLIYVLPDFLQVPAPRRKCPRFALGSIRLREVGIGVLDVLAFPGQIARIVDSEVFDAVEEGGGALSN
jgi:hypothetical protein